MYQRAIEKIKLVNFAIQSIKVVYSYTDVSLNVKNNVKLAWVKKPLELAFSVLHKQMAVNAFTS